MSPETPAAWKSWRDELADIGRNTGWGQALDEAVRRIRNLSDAMGTRIRALEAELRETKNTYIRLASEATERAEKAEAELVEWPNRYAKDVRALEAENDRLRDIEERHEWNTNAFQGLPEAYRKERDRAEKAEAELAHFRSEFVNENQQRILVEAERDALLKENRENRPLIEQLRFKVRDYDALKLQLERALFDVGALRSLQNETARCANERGEEIAALKARVRQFEIEWEEELQSMRNVVARRLSVEDSKERERAEKAETRVAELEAADRLLMARCPTCGLSTLQMSATHASVHGAPVYEGGGRESGGPSQTGGTGAVRADPTAANSAALCPCGYGEPHERVWPHIDPEREPRERDCGD